MGGGEVTRLEKLEAVAEAARVWCANRPDVIEYDSVMPDTKALFDTIAALDAHTEVPQETVMVMVTLALWRGADGQVALDIAGSDDDVAYNTTWTRLGTVTLPLDLEDGR